MKVVAYSARRPRPTRWPRACRAKGYSAYVVPVTGKGTALYSVRVGKFATRQEADAAKRRLEKEEQLKPSIAR